MHSTDTAKTKKVFLIIGILMAATELVKQILLTVSAGGQYQWWYFPWQLCSMPMYVCIVIGLCRNRRICDACVAFLSDFGLLAGICAFLDTSGFQYEIAVLTVHSYLWHIALIVLGIYAWCIRAKNADVSSSVPYADALGAAGIYLLGCAVAEVINIAAFDSGHRPIDMFYISPRYLMGQVYIRDLVPVIGNGWCIILYILVTIFGAMLIELAGRLCKKWVKTNRWF